MNWVLQRLADINLKKILKFCIFGTKKTNLLTALVFIPYLTFYIFPGFVFSNKAHEGRFKIYSHEAIKNPGTFVKRIEDLIEQSEIDDKKVNFNIYITQNHYEYMLFSLIYRGSFALYSPVSGNIYINKSDVNQNEVSRSNDHFKRKLESTIAHEAVHKLTRAHLGLVGFYKQPSWIREGYPDYIAGESTYSYEMAAPLINAHTIENNKSAMYLVYAEAVRIYKERGLSFDEIIKLKKDWSSVKAEAFERIIEKSKFRTAAI